MRTSGKKNQLGLQLHLKRKGKATLKKEWIVKEGEYMDILCYTRSCSGAGCTITLNGEVLKTITQVICDFDETTDGGEPRSTCHTLISKIEGSANGSRIVLELHDLCNANKKFNDKSKGFFLVVGDVRRADATAPADATSPEATS